MRLNLSRTLQVVCCLLGATGLSLVAMPFIDVARGEYDSPVAAVAGIFVCLLAGGFYWLSRSKAAQRPNDQRIFASLLWVAAMVCVAAAMRFLYYYVDTYLLRHYWLT